MEPNPFPDLKVAPFDFLDECESRRECPKCGKSRKYYCYSCYVPVKGTEDKVPLVKLPVTVDIIKHPGEVDGKSTASHAGVLAPDDVHIYTYPVIPDYTDKSRVILIFPGETSISLEELASQCQPLISSCVDNSLQSNSGTNPAEKNVDKSHSSKTKDDEDTPEPNSSRATSVSINKSSCDHSDISAGTEISNKKVECEEVPNASQEQPCTRSADLDCSPSRQCRTSCSQKRGESSLEQCDDSPVTKKPRRHAVYQCPFDKVVFIDSTWNQSNKIFVDERLKGLKQVELKTRFTKFWRHQRDKPSTYLATIEAVYYFLRDYHEYFVEGEYNGEYDNLLFFFCFMYQKIRGLYDGGKELKAYQKTKKS